MAEELFTAPELSEQEQIRRAKLEKYQTEGRDPYTITRYDRTHTSCPSSASKPSRIWWEVCVRS